MISGGSIAVASGGMGFFVFAIVHVLGSRAGKAHARLLTLAFVISLIVCAGLAAGWNAVWTTGTSTLLVVPLAAMVCASLFVCYVPALYVILTSQSVATIIWLRRMGQPMPEIAFFDRFASRSVVDDRLATLQMSGYVWRDGENFYLTARGRSIARLFKSISVLWNLDAGG
jgi:hypothetical protein